MKTYPTIKEAAAALAAGQVTAVALAEEALSFIDRYDGEINACLRVERELALREAAESDARRAAGQTKGALDGIPYTLKDVYASVDSPTTAASRMLEGWTAPYNATVYTRLKEAGAVMVAKVNTDEFTMGGSTESSYWGVTRNPWDHERVSGGSSGGSAAAVAAGYGYFSVGTDTGGSIRQPASYCGVVGLRPTYGRISRMGQLPMASSLDQTGPLARTVEDAAYALQALAGHDPLDATSAEREVPDYVGALASFDLKGVRIGVPQEYFGEGNDPEAEALVRQSLDRLAEQGAVLVPISLPAATHALAAYYVIAPAEISSNMARYDGIHFGYSVEREGDGKDRSLYDVYAESRARGLGAEVKRRIILGTYVLSAGYADRYYHTALAVRDQVRQEFAQAFEGVDLIAGPVVPSTAFKIGEKVSDPLSMYQEDVLTVPLNIAGIPGISVPCGLVRGLPVGLQLMAPAFAEDRLLAAAAAFERVRGTGTETSPLLSE